MGGENVSALEVEDYIAGHQAVDIVQVVGAPDARYGEVPAAFIQLKPGAQARRAELIEFCRGQDRHVQGSAVRAVRHRVADVGHQDPEVRAA